MIKINEHYLKLKATYLFADIKKRVNKFQEENPDINVIKLGIGDVTLPLPKACTEALHKAVDELATVEGFRGYGPEQGYDFLRSAIATNDFRSRGISIEDDEVFVSDGAKCDTGNIQEIFDKEISIGVPDPVYPVYVDTNVMAGRTGENENGRYGKLVYLEGTAENNFVPSPPKEKLDLIFLCFPNNPTGSVATKEQLKAWVDYARENKSVILFDAAYEAFVKDDSIPRSIYEIEGAAEVAIEFRSFSKSAGFTGLRAAYTVVPKSVMGYDSKGNAHSLHSLWFRRHSTKFNGLSYPVQRAAEAAYSEEGKAQCRELVDYYMSNAIIVKEAIQKLGFKATGGDNSPYIWIEGGRPSWDFFDLLLNQAGVVCTPGEGFGTCGAGYIRISAFNSRENVEEAMDRISKALQ